MTSTLPAKNDAEGNFMDARFCQDARQLYAAKMAPDHPTSDQEDCFGRDTWGEGQQRTLDNIKREFSEEGRICGEWT
jgi:hypothetical protein